MLEVGGEFADGAAPPPTVAVLLGHLLLAQVLGLPEAAHPEGHQQPAVEGVHSEGHQQPRGPERQRVHLGVRLGEARHQPRPGVDRDQPQVGEHLGEVQQRCVDGSDGLGQRGGS